MATLEAMLAEDRSSLLAALPRVPLPPLPGWFVVLARMRGFVASSQGWYGQPHQRDALPRLANHRCWRPHRPTRHSDREKKHRPDDRVCSVGHGGHVHSPTHRPKGAVDLEPPALMAAAQMLVSGWRARWPNSHKCVRAKTVPHGSCLAMARAAAIRSLRHSWYWTQVPSSAWKSPKARLTMLLCVCVADCVQGRRGRFHCGDAPHQSGLHHLKR